MSAKNSGKMLVLVAACVCILGGIVRADKAQLLQKLSADFEIRLTDVTIVEALDKIGQKAGVKLALSDEAVWKLPYGEATRLSVTLQGPLADSLTEMLNAFFMRYAVGEEGVTIYPREELDHILGTPTTKQLELLRALYTEPIEVYLRDDVQQSINAALGQKVLISPIGVLAELNNLLRQLAGIEPIYAPDPRRPPPPRGIVKAREPEPNEPEPAEFVLPTPVTVVQLLSQVVIGRDSSETRWYISGIDLPGQMPEVRVVHSTLFAELKLDQTIDVSYKEESLDRIFRALTSRAGLVLVAGPGGTWLAESKVSASMQNVKIRQAINSIADMVGAECSVERDGRVLLGLHGPPKSKDERQSTGTLAPDGYVGKISIPMEGGKYFLEFMLRQSDLPKELSTLRDEAIRDVLGESAREAKLKEAIKAIKD
ncbi:MAG: hypothetical protein A2Z25_05870 [Planctomycetes bacterium RBG_16_55_9]|nr:MAG: hypothetical protein A2Z25_05870 [Planctomycetes bacterium RBG_16_55_9]